MKSKKTVFYVMLALLLSLQLFGVQNKTILEGNDAVPVMSSNNLPIGNVSASSVYYNRAAYQPWKAFDGNDVSGAGSRWISHPNQLPAWISYEFDKPVIISAYYILTEYTSLKNRSPKSWNFQAWDGSNWKNIDTRSNIQLDVDWNSNGVLFSVEEPGLYKKYRLYITELCGSTVASILRLKLYQPTDKVPVMTSGNSPSGKAVASSCYYNNLSYKAWKAFDGDDVSSAWSRWISHPNQLPAWLSYEFESPRVIAGYYILTEYTSLKDRSPQSWKFEGWSVIQNTWVEIESRNKIYLDTVWSARGLFFYVDNTENYLKYRLLVKGTCGSTVVSIRQLKLFQPRVLKITKRLR